MPGSVQGRGGNPTPTAITDDVRFEEALILFPFGIQKAKMPKKFRKMLAMSTKSLLELRKELDKEIAEREKNPNLEEEIAYRFAGEEERIAKLYFKTPYPNDKSQFRVAAKIFCSSEKCDRCPHGPFFFKYKNYKSGNLKVTFTGTPFFDLDILEMRKREAENRPPPARVSLEVLARAVQTGENIDLNLYRQRNE